MNVVINGPAGAKKRQSYDRFGEQITQKARVLRHAAEEGVNHIWMVSALQLHPRGIIVCDEEATVKLKVGTAKYFKDMESANLDPAALLK